MGTKTRTNFVVSGSEIEKISEYVCLGRFLSLRNDLTPELSK